MLFEKDKEGNILYWADIREESVDPAKKTGGHFQTISTKISIPANTGETKNGYSHTPRSE